MQLINKSENVFSPIDSEEYREYEFKDKQLIKIVLPLFLSVSKSGGHRILDNKGISHYIPSGWIHLTWKAKEGLPHFVK